MPSRPPPRGPLAQLQGEIYLGWARADLNFFARVIEAEHIDFDNPCAWRHAIKLKGAAEIRGCKEDASPLGGFNDGPGNRLALGLDDAALTEARDRDPHAGDKKISIDVNDEASFAGVRRVIAS